MSDSKISTNRARARSRQSGMGPSQNRGCEQSNYMNGPWGDSYRHKQANTFRYFFNNINGLPVSVTHDCYQRIQEKIEKLHIDFLGLTEINLNLKLLPSNEQWRDRFNKSKHTH